MYSLEWAKIVIVLNLDSPLSLMCVSFVSCQHVFQGKEAYLDLKTMKAKKEKKKANKLDKVEKTNNQGRYESIS